MHLLPYRPQKLGEKHGDLLLREIQKIDHLRGWGQYAISEIYKIGETAIMNPIFLLRANYS